MSGHTPEPWVPEGLVDNIHIVQLHAPHIRVCFLTSDGPVKANAYLIAAAPKLLRCLKVIVDTYGGDDPARDAPMLKSARQAIADAEGRT